MTERMKPDAHEAAERRRDLEVADQHDEISDLPSDSKVARLFGRLRRCGKQYEDQIFRMHCTDTSGQRETSVTSQRTTSGAAAESDATGSRDYAEPRSIGRFQIIRRLGQGGYGLVFLAYDPRLKRPVALKVPRPEALMTPELRTRFLREAEAAAALNHPNVVPVFETGSDGAICYIASAYVEGMSLAEWLSSEFASSTPRDAAQLSAALADAIQHAHNRGILHRDLKPANVLLAQPKTTSDAAGSLAGFVPQITDFGLAKIKDVDSGYSRSGSILGTPAYISPEQAGNAARDAGPASDVYSLGVILYELLAGRPPFQADSLLDLLQAVRHQEPEPFRRGAVPVDLESICLKCLEKQPARRYRSAAGLADDLKRFMAGEPVEARPATNRERLARWCQRNPLVSGLSAVVLLLVLTLAVGSTIAAVTLARAQSETLDSLENEILAKDRATQSEDNALRALYEARLMFAAAQRNSGLPGQSFESLQAVRDAHRHTTRLGLGEDETLRQRNEAIAAMALVDLRLDKQWPGLPPRSGSPVIGLDADATRYARPEADNRIVIRSIEDNRELLSVAGLGSFDPRPYTRFSHNGAWLAVRGADQNSIERMQIWNLREPGAPALDELAAGPGGNGANFAFAPDDRRFAFALPGGGIGIVDLETMAVERRIDLGSTPGWLQFNPDGTTLALTRIDKPTQVVFIDIASGETVGKPCVHPFRVNHGDWSHDGRLLAVAGGDMHVYVWDISSRQQMAVCRGHRHAVNHVAFAHHSDLLMSTGMDMTTRLWEPLTGRQLLKTNGRATQFSPDDRWLGQSFAGVEIGRWEVASRREFFLLPAIRVPNSFAYSLEYSPDGRSLAVSGQSDGVGIWDMQARREIARLPFRASSATFAENGASLFIGGHGNGIQEWPIAEEADGGLCIGPPQMQYSVGYRKTALSLASDGNTAVVNTSWDTAFVLDLGTGEKVHTLHSPDVRFHAISPDGQWIATGSWRGNGAKVWDARTGEVIRELPLTGSVRVTFSPDGRWLLTSTYDGYACWRVGTWERAHHRSLEGYSYRSAALSRDGNLAAVSLRRGVKLLDPASGTEYATLVPPEDFTARCLALSPNGRQLAVGTQEGPIYVWQLDQLRERLADLDLDWDLPPLALLTPGDLPKIRARVELP